MSIVAKVIMGFCVEPIFVWAIGTGAQAMKTKSGTTMHWKTHVQSLSELFWVIDCAKMKLFGATEHVLQRVDVKEIILASVQAFLEAAAGQKDHQRGF